MSTFFRFLVAGALSLAFFASGTAVFAADGCELGEAPMSISRTAGASCNQSCTQGGYASGRMLSDDGWSTINCCCRANSPDLNPPSPDPTNPIQSEVPSGESSSGGGGAATCDEIVTAKRAVTGTVTDMQMLAICNSFSQCNSYPACIALTEKMLCDQAQAAIDAGSDKTQVCAEYSTCPACAGVTMPDPQTLLCKAIDEWINEGKSKEAICATSDAAKLCPACVDTVPGFTTVCADLARTLADSPDQKDAFCALPMYAVCVECGGPGETPAPALEMKEWKPVSGKSRVDDGLATALSNAKYNTLSPGQIAGKVIKVILQILGLFFLIMVVYAGVQWLTAAGDEKRIAESVRILWASVIGMAIAIAAYAFTVYLLNAIKAASG